MSNSGAAASILGYFPICLNFGLFYFFFLSLFLRRVCSFLCLISLILWCAAIASWAPFQILGYHERFGATIVASHVIPCGTSQAGNLFEVTFSGDNVTRFIAIVEPFQFALDSINATLDQRSLYPVGWRGKTL